MWQNDKGWGGRAPRGTKGRLAMPSLSVMSTGIPPESSSSWREWALFESQCVQKHNHSSWDHFKSCLYSPLLFTTFSSTKTCCVPNTSQRVDHVQRYWISKTEASPEGWQPRSVVSLQTWHPASQGHVWTGTVACGTLPWSKHHPLPTPPLTATPPHVNFITLQSPVSSARGSKLFLTTLQRTGLGLHLGPLAGHHLFSLPLDPGLWFPLTLSQVMAIWPVQSHRTPCLLWWFGVA